MRAARRSSPYVTGILMISAGTIVQVGWVLGNPYLKAIVPGLTTMNPLTALCFIASGASIILAGLSDGRKWCTATVQVMSTAVLFSMFTLLIRSWVSWDSSLDQLLFRSEVFAQRPFPSRVAPNTAFAFTCLSTALLLSGARTNSTRILRELFAVATGLTAFVALLGYLYEVSMLRQVGMSIPMALNTAILFSIGSFGVLMLKPDFGLAGVLTESYAGSVTARRVILIAIVVPALIGWLRLRGEELGIFDSAHGIALMVLFTSVITGAVTIWNAVSLNSMERELRTKQGLLEESQERQKALNLELAEKVRALEVANKELESFSYSVSHDLRAPLRSIIGFSNSVLEDAGPQLAEALRMDLKRVVASARRMGELIDGLLALSRLSRSEISPSPVDLAQMAQSIMQDLRQGDPGRTARVILPTSALAARGDSRMLRALLDNLLSNAWKFTRGRDEAIIEFGEMPTSKGGPAYFVRDNGVGFDMQYSSKLFVAFQRLHDASSFEGTGIGLATARRIIERHGGRIWVDSAIGKGTTFFFTLKSEKVSS